MSSSFSVNDSISSSRYGTPPSFNIRGRIIPYGEFLPRLKNYCLSLGFKKPTVMIPESSAALDTMSVDNPDAFFVGGKNTSPGHDLVIILSTKVPYEPSWGGYSGLPRPLIHERADHRTKGTVSNFIAPYLVQFQFAQNHIYLAGNDLGQHLITLPPDYIKGGTESGGKNLKILLDKIVEPDEEGTFHPHVVSDSFVSFLVSEQFSQVLGERNFSWKAGKVQRIGTYLSAELFVFEDAQQSNGSNGSKNTFAETLLPAMNSIVTNINPQLRAALIHLQSEFSQVVDDVLCTHGEDDSESLLCIAGLDIDVAAFRGRGKRYFVPWTAYWRQGGIQKDTTDNRLKQDDLFVALMAQEKELVPLFSAG